MSNGELLMLMGAIVWLVGEGIGLFTKDTTSHWVKLWTKSRWWHRAIIVILGVALIAHFNGVFFSALIS